MIGSPMHVLLANPINSFYTTLGLTNRSVRVGDGATGIPNPRTLSGYVWDHPRPIPPASMEPFLSRQQGRYIVVGTSSEIVEVPSMSHTGRRIGRGWVWTNPRRNPVQAPPDKVLGSGMPVL
jgi:hypothetical protein